MAYPYTGKPPGAGGIQNLREISPPLTVVKVAAPGPDNMPGHCAGLFHASCLTDWYQVPSIIAYVY